MSRSSENDLMPLLTILESIGKIEIYVRSFDNALDFFQYDDQVKFNATLLLLLNIGEQINKLSDNVKQRHLHFPFNEIRGLRNRIAHDYTGIDYEMVFDIAKEDIPAIRLKAMLLINVELSQGTFDLGELNAAKTSLFYKHVDFDKFTVKIN